MWCSLRQHVISILLFADDLVLLAEDRPSMQRMLDFLSKYAHRWRFIFNLPKCDAIELGLILFGIWIGSSTKNVLLQKHVLISLRFVVLLFVLEIFLSLPL